MGNGDAWDGMEYALEFATYSFEVAIIMMIDAEAIAFGITNMILARVDIYAILVLRLCRYRRGHNVPLVSEPLGGGEDGIVVVIVDVEIKGDDFGST